MQDTKYQTSDIKMVSGTVKGKYTDNVELDSNFDYCDGIQAIEILPGGVPLYAIGLEDKNNTYHSITHKNDWINGTNTPINNRYKEIFVPVIRGDKLEIKTQFDNDLTTDLYYQLIFRLRKKPKGK